MSASVPHQDPYTGLDNLEVMREAENYNRYLIDLIGKHAGGARRVLDFGAGSGTFAVPCQQLGFDVTAIEPDERLRGMLASAGVAAAADPAELPDESIDYAYSLNVLEHIPDDVGALRAIFTKLVPGGRVLIYVPAFPILFTSMDAKVGHVRRYTSAKLSESMTTAGFALERIRYADSLGFLATLVFKLADNGRGDVNRPLLRLYDRVAFPVSRALDAIAGGWFGKNLWAVARKPSR